MDTNHTTQKEPSAPIPEPMPNDKHRTPTYTTSQFINKKLAVIFSFIIVILIAGVWTANYFLNKNSNKQIACTLDAMICPDGSSVGRTGPQCEFSPCKEIFLKNSDWDTYSSERIGNWKKYIGATSVKGYSYTLLYPNSCSLKHTTGSTSSIESLVCPEISAEIQLGSRISTESSEIMSEKNIFTESSKLITEKSIILGINANWGKSTYKITPPGTRVTYGLDNNDNGHSFVIRYSDYSEKAEAMIEQIISTFDLPSYPEVKKITDQIKTDLSKEYRVDEYEIPENAIVHYRLDKVIKGVIIKKGVGAARYVSIKDNGQWKTIWKGNNGIPKCSALSDLEKFNQLMLGNDTSLCSHK